MAAIDFPASPTDGQQFTAGNGIVYQWQATPGIWMPIGGPAAGIMVYVGVTPPASPFNNQLWWNSELGVLYIYYNDGNSLQWVPAVTPSFISSGYRMLGRFVITSPVPRIDFTSAIIPSDINFLDCSFDLMPDTDNVNLWFQMFDNTGTIDAASGHYVWESIGNYSSNATTSGNALTNSSAAYGSTGVAMGYPTSGGCVSSNPTNGGIDGSFRMYNIRQSTRWKHMTWQASHFSQNQAYGTNTNGSGTRAIGGAVTGARLAFGAGNIAPGSIATLWGSP